MTILTLEEATSFIHSYGMKCDRQQVKQLVLEGKIKGLKKGDQYFIEEDEVHTYLHWYMWQGTAYEQGINDQIKIARLLEEIRELRQENKRLHEENINLKNEMEVIPF